jgi:competence protein ComEC
MTLIYVSIAWLAGIYAGSHVRVDRPLILLISLIPLAAALLWRKHEIVRLPAICLVVIALGIIRYDSALPAPDYGSIAVHVGPRTVDVGGIVVAEPDIRDTDIRLTVSAYHIGSGQDSYPVSGNVQVKVPRYSTYRYGDDLLLKGTLQDLPDDDTFSYRGYLLRQGIFATMYHPSIEIINRNQGNRLLATLYSFKQRLQTAITIYLPEPQAGLVQGILLGVKAVLTDDLKTDLTQTGLTHIIVVSGYNMTVVATLLQRLTEKRLRRRFSLLIALGGVIIFTLMTGASVPVVRAAVMVSMTLLARAVGRESDALTALLFTGSVLVLFSPMTLWDVSFQLSFLATMGLVLLAPTLERLMERLPLGIGSLLGTTIAAQIMTLPVIAINFHRISLISLPANLLVQPAIPPLMVAGAMVAFAGLTGLMLVRAVGWLAWLIGAYMVRVIHALGSLPLASVDIPTLPVKIQPIALFVYFATVGLAFFVATHLRRQNLATLPQQARTALRQPQVIIGILALLATAVWALIVYALHTTPY